MEKNTQGLVAIFAILALLVGFALGAVLIPGEVETITKPGEIVYQNVSVPQIVEVNAPSQLDLAVAEFKQAVEDEEDEAGRDVLLDELEDNYYFDEMSVRDVDDEYKVKYDGDVTTVYFSIDLRFDDGYGQDKATYDVKVVFEDDEDTKVKVLA